MDTLITPLFDDIVIGSIRERLLSRSETIAVAESVTSGLLQLAISTADDAIKFYQGGLTAYNLGQKSRHLHIEPIHALSHNCVSERTAGEMAIGISDLFKSDWGLGITGYASPVPESDHKLFAFYAIAYKKDVIETKRIKANKDDPLHVQSFYVNKLINSLHQLLL
jgi:PncC family amidohydrolase